MAKKFKYPKAQAGLSMIDPNTMFASAATTEPSSNYPVFKNKEEHNAFHRKRLLESNKGTGLYQKYLEYSVNRVGLNADADALLAAMGGIPEYVVEQKPVGPSRILDIDFKPKKTQGYRYKKGLPDKESITP